MPLTTKTQAELEQLVRSHLRNLIPGGADVSPGSDYDVMARVVAAIFLGNQEQARYIARQILPTTADADFVLLHAAVRALELLSAAKATGSVFIQASVAGTPQPISSVLEHSDGTRYTTIAAFVSATPTFSGKTVGSGSTSRRVIVLPSVSGISANDAISINGVVRVVKEVLASINAVEVYFDFPAAPTPTAAIDPVTGMVASIVAEKTGEDGNKLPGDTLTLESPGLNVEEVTTVLELSGGGDEETIDELRSRVLDVMSVRPGSGNVEDYRQWARETPDVRLADAFVYAGYRGAGAIDIIPFGISGARITSAEAVTKIDTHVRTKAPATDDLRVLQLAEESPAIAVALAITVKRGYEKDWEGSYTLDGSAHTTSRISLLSFDTGAIEIGDRILIAVDHGGKTKTFQVNVTSVFAAQIDFEPALPAVPAAGTEIYPGGPNTQDVLDAIESLFDTRGTGELDVAAGKTYERHPAPADLWDYRVRVGHIIAAVLGVTGVDGVTVTAPASDQEPDPLARLGLGEITLTFA